MRFRLTIFITLSNFIRNKLLRVVIPLAFWLGVWQLAAILMGQEAILNAWRQGDGAALGRFLLYGGKELLLPSPVSVGVRLLELAGTAPFWQAAALTLGRVLFGFLGGAAVGAFLAVLTALSHRAEWLLAPAVRVMRAIPVASFILLLMLWFSTGLVPGVCAGLMVLPVVWENVAKGIRETDLHLLEMARAYRFHWGKVIRLVYLPSALPYFASGCATGFGLAWKAGVAAEVLSLPRLAIGLEIRNAKLYVETPTLFAWTVVVIFLSLLLEQGFAALFQRVRGGWRL